MTKSSTKVEAEYALAIVNLTAEDLDVQASNPTFRKADWFKKAYVDTDDHGWCVAVKVDRQKYLAATERIPAIINGVKIVVLLT